MKTRLALSVLVAAVLGACTSVQPQAFPGGEMRVERTAAVAAPAQRPIAARSSLSEADLKVLQQAAKDVLNPDPRKSRDAVLLLRGGGVEGLDALLAAHELELQQWTTRTSMNPATFTNVAGSGGIPEQQLASLAAVVDEVAMQKYAA